MWSTLCAIDSRGSLAKSDSFSCTILTTTATFDFVVVVLHGASLSSISER